MEAEPSGKCREAGGKTLEGQFKEELGSYRESHELQSDEDYSCKTFSESMNTYHT